MSLATQIQVFLGTIAITMLDIAIYGAFNRLLYKWHGKWKRLVLEIPLFILGGYGYFLFLVNTCQGQLNIHIVLAFLLGFFLYQRFYAFYVNLWYEKIARYINKKILHPVTTHLHKIYDIISLRKKRRRRKHGKRNKKQTLN